MIDSHWFKLMHGFQSKADDYVGANGLRAFLAFFTNLDLYTGGFFFPFSMC